MIKFSMGARNVYERILWFDRQIRRGRYPNATKLAREFEISTKTAQRDIEFMRDRLFFPLKYAPDRKGYYYTDETFMFPLSFLSSSELTTLLIAKRLLEEMAEGAFKEEMNRFFSKLFNIVDKTVSIPIEDLFSVEIPEHTITPEKIFKQVVHACIKRLRLRFTYYSPSKDEVTNRTVDPYHLLNYCGTWHLIAYCHLREKIRDFVLARMKDVTVLDEEFVLDPLFDLKEYLGSAFGIFKGTTTEWVVLKFSPRRARWVKHQLWHSEQQVKENSDGSVIISFPVADLREVKMEVLKYGAEVEVIEPLRLKEEILKEAKAIVDIYKR
jgi:predicted DNA-binding transcriptional regulator YafY